MSTLFANVPGRSCPESSQQYSSETSFYVTYIGTFCTKSVDQDMRLGWAKLYKFNAYCYSLQHRHSVLVSTSVIGNKFGNSQSKYKNAIYLSWWALKTVPSVIYMADMTMSIPTYIILYTICPPPPLLVQFSNEWVKRIFWQMKQA